MRLLFLTNFYPPTSRGGYEQWCQEVTDELRARGHDVLVLTSTYGRNTSHSLDQSWVRRELHLEMEFASLRNAFQFFTGRKRREQDNLTVLKDTIENYKPDTVLIWGMWNLPRSLPSIAEKLMPGRVAYYIGDYWVTLPSQFDDYWIAPARNLITGFPKLVLRPIAQQMLAHEDTPDLQLEHVLFPTSFMRDELKRLGISPKNTKIIYGAIRTKHYRGPQNPSKQDERISLLYIGRLSYEKGVHIAIEAMGQLIREDALVKMHLTIVGEGEPEYVDYLHKLAKREQITSYITFLPAQPKGALPAIYREADIFLFTSIWPEPFGRVIVEAMASGIAVIGSRVGGATEILVHEENALTFTPDNTTSLSQQIKRLIESPSLRKRLANSGREIAMNNFDIHRMSTEIESYLHAIIH